MPNIEIHGRKDDEEYLLVTTRRSVFHLFKDNPFIEDIVVTVVRDEAEDIHRTSKPYFRVFSNDSEELKYVSNRLAVLGDVEAVLLFRFIQRQT